MFEGEAPAAVTDEELARTALDPSANGDGVEWLRKLERLERAESKSDEERRASAAGERQARWDAEYELAEQGAAERRSREARERRARWQAEDDRLAREFSEQRERWQAEYEQAEREAEARAVQEAKQRP